MSREIESQRLGLSLNGVLAEATLLTSTAPRAVASFVSWLPLEGAVFQAVWSGHAAAFQLPEGFSAAQDETAVSFIDVGGLALPETGRQLLISYGPCTSLAATGHIRATRIAELVVNRDVFLGELANVATQGATQLRMELRW